LPPPGAAAAAGSGVIGGPGYGYGASFPLAPPRIL
jgi:hypothetical protein